MRINLSVLMATLALGGAAAAWALPVSSGGSSGSSSSAGFSGASSSGGASYGGSGGAGNGGGGGSGSHGGGGGAGNGGGSGSHGGGGGSSTGHAGGGSTGHGSGSGGWAGHGGAGWAGRGGAGAANGNGEFAAARPAFGAGGHRLPEMRTLTHGAALAVRSEERAHRPHPIHPTRPIHPRASIVRAQYNSGCSDASACGPRMPNLYFCDPYMGYTETVNRSYPCPQIRKSRIVDPIHPGSH